MKQSKHSKEWVRGRRFTSIKLKSSDELMWIKNLVIMFLYKNSPCSYDLLRDELTKVDGVSSRSIAEVSNQLIEYGTVEFVSGFPLVLTFSQEALAVLNLLSEKLL